MHERVVEAFLIMFTNKYTRLDIRSIVLKYWTGECVPRKVIPDKGSLSCSRIDEVYMKKIFKIIGIILIILVLIGGCLGLATYFGLFDFLHSDEVTVRTYTTDNGYTYTKRTWSWQPKEFKEKINYIENTSSIPSKIVSLCVEDNTYIDITVPRNINYMWDFGKTIWAEDGSYQIRLIKGLENSSLSVTAGIDNPYSLSPTVVTTNDKKKGMRTVAAALGDVYVIADIYEGDETYSLIRKSLLSATPYEISKSYNVTSTNLDDISYTGSFQSSVTFQEVSLMQERYLFEKGALYIQSDVRAIQNVADEYLNRLYVFSGEEPSLICHNNGLYYAEAGDYYLGLIEYNSNTTIVLLGSGEEAKCNIVTIISYLR